MARYKYKSKSKSTSPEKYIKSLLLSSFIVLFVYLIPFKKFKNKANVIYISFIVFVVVYVLILLFPKLETYADYIDEPWGETMYDLMPHNFNVFLINLDSKKKRLENFISAYKKTDLFTVKNMERISAVNGRELSINDLVSDKGRFDINMVEKKGYRIRHNQLTRGAVGCYMSHMNIYKMMRDRKEQYAIIFEDDVKFNKSDIYREVRKRLAKIPDDWDMFLLGCICQVCKKNTGYQDIQHFFLMHAYVIKQSGAIKILNELEFMPIRQQIDSELSVMAINNKLKIYCSNTFLVAQDSKINATSIQTPMKYIQGINPYDLV